MKASSLFSGDMPPAWPVFQKSEKTEAHKTEKTKSAALPPYQGEAPDPADLDLLGDQLQLVLKEKAALFLGAGFGPVGLNRAPQKNWIQATALHLKQHTQKAEEAVLPPYEAVLTSSAVLIRSEWTLERYQSVQNVLKDTQRLEDCWEGWLCVEPVRSESELGLAATLAWLNYGVQKIKTFFNKQAMPLSEDSRASLRQIAQELLEARDGLLTQLEATAGTVKEQPEGATVILEDSQVQALLPSVARLKAACNSIETFSTETGVARKLSEEKTRSSRYLAFALWGINTLSVMATSLGGGFVVAALSRWCHSAFAASLNVLHAGQGDQLDQLKEAKAPLINLFKNGLKELDMSGPATVGELHQMATHLQEASRQELTHALVAVEEAHQAKFDQFQQLANSLVIVVSTLQKENQELQTGISKKIEEASKAAAEAASQKTMDLVLQNFDLTPKTRS